MEANLNDPTAVRVFVREGVDFGAPPRDTVEQKVGTLTPLTTPGARTISTGELYNALRNNRRLLVSRRAGSLDDGEPSRLLTRLVHAGELSVGSTALSAALVALSPPMLLPAFATANAPSPVAGNRTTTASQVPSEPEWESTGPLRPPRLASIPHGRL
jgi:hypothetical protein